MSTWFAATVFVVFPVSKPTCVGEETLIGTLAWNNAEATNGFPSPPEDCHGYTFWVREHASRILHGIVLRVVRPNSAGSTYLVFREAGACE